MCLTFIIFVSIINECFRADLDYTSLVFYVILVGLSLIRILFHFYTILFAHVIYEGSFSLYIDLETCLWNTE